VKVPIRRIRPRLPQQVAEAWRDHGTLMPIKMSARQIDAVKPLGDADVCEA